MASTSDRRATTLSISLTPELARQVSQRVESGLYSSASELFREALRLLLRRDDVRSPEGERLDEAIRMQEEFLAMPRDAGGISEKELRVRMAQASLEQHLYPGVRLAPERTEKILRGPEPKRDEQGS